jgi:4-amino-4-deoxy-L-arabinose transferase-like glycosyltransferase
MSLLRRDPYLRWALLLALVALVIRACSIWSNLPDVPNPDEFITIWPPLRMAYGTWYATGGYPPLYAYLMLAEYGAFFVLGTLVGQFHGTMDFARQVLTDPTPLYLLGRTTSVLLGTATVVALYAVGRRLYDGRVGLLAAAFLTVDTVHVYASQVVKADVLMVFLVVLSAWFAAGILREGRTRQYVLAGLLAGLAIAAKYNAAIAILPIVAAHLLRCREEKATLWQALRPSLLWLAGLGTIAGFLLGYPHFILDPGLAWEGLRSHSIDFFWAWLGWEGVPPGWIYYPLIALNTAWGLPLQLLALVGLGAAFVRRRPADLLLSVLPLANYLLMGSMQVNQPRYFLLGMPFLLVLAARLLVGLAERVALSRPLRQAAFPIALVVLLAWPTGMSLLQDYLRLQPDPRVTARQWIEANVPAGSHVVLDTGGPALPASAESLLAFDGPPQGRFAELEREVAATYTLTYWILPIHHFICCQFYLEEQEATVEPLDWYRTKGYEYIVTSSLVYNSYRRWPGVAARYPQTMAFYDSVAEEATLVAEFKPVIQDPRDFTNVDLNPIPTVRVYRLDPAR